MAEYWSTVLYLALFFSVFAGYRRLLLAHYQISYVACGISLAKALVLAKVIRIAESLGLGRGFKEKPLIVATLYKSFLFGLCVALFGVVESIIRSLAHGKVLTAALAGVVGRFDYEWLAGALVVLFAFIPFFAMRELREILGEGTMSKLFFHQRSAVEFGPKKRAVGV